MDKQYQFKEVEARLRRWWLDEGIYALDVTNPHVMSVDTPPPTVSGSLHIGHIFSYTQTDIMVRYKRMRGHAMYYPFGFDDNGLPTERFVEKQHGIAAHKLSRSQFIQLCLDTTAPVEDAFKELWQRMGLSVDWNYTYTTIGRSARKISQTSFLRLYERGFIYRKNEPALYCTHCRTTVAQAELDDAQQPSAMYELTFSATSGVATSGAPLIIATTRPELLPACVAVLYHPDDARYQHLQGTQAQVPLFNYTVPIYADPHVQPDKGTGLVMCCTFGDTTDIVWYKQYQLPYRAVMAADGTWLPSTGFLAGKKVKEARAAVIEAAQAAGLLGAQRELVHTVNIHERCRQPIEFLVQPQWFLKILPYKKQLCELADHINWYPAFMKTRYIHWVENITWDWCLSRQRFFGIPFPVWHCTACQEVLLPAEERLPLDPQEEAWPRACSKCGGGPVVPDTDVMDTWNTSSLTPYLCEVLRTGDEGIFDKPFTPFAMRPQAHDIIRTWAFYTIVKTWMHHGTVPWNDIVISGHVLSGSGDKLSKSKGNSLQDPDQLLDRYPADAVRFWTTSGSLGQDTLFSEQQLQSGNRLITKLWNAFRFIAEYTSSADSLMITNPQQIIHRWMLHRLSELYEQYVTYNERYEPSLALGALEQVFWKDFCDTYLELIKDQFFNPDCYTVEQRAETRAMLRIIGLRLLQLYAPVISYCTEELYHKVYGAESTAKSLHMTRFEEFQHSFFDEYAVRVMNLVSGIVGAVRRGKTEQKLSLRTDLVTLNLVVTPEQQAALADQERLIAGATRSQKICWVAQQGAAQQVPETAPTLELRADGWHGQVIVDRAVE